MGFGRDVRSGDLQRKVETFCQVEVNQFGPASLITRNTNDVQQVQTVVFMGLTIMVSAPILDRRRDHHGPPDRRAAVRPPARRPAADGRSSSALVMSRAIPLFRAMQVKLDRINQVMRETLAGVRVIRAFVRTRHEEARFDDASHDLFDTALRVEPPVRPDDPDVISRSSTSRRSRCMWFGAMRVDDGALPIGNLTAFLQYLTQILFAVLTAVFMFILDPARGGLRRPDPGGPRDRAVDPRPGDAGRARSDRPGRGVVEFRDVEFGYPGAEEPVLHDISFRAEPGETTAIVGSTGSGKSTLVNLIPRFYDATGGAVLVDGVDVREHGPRGPVGADRVHPAEGVPVRRDGREQPPLRRRGRDRRRALARARHRPGQATSSSEMDGGLEAPITQGGSERVGRPAPAPRDRPGARQATPPIYIFDDSFSALDFATDARLRAALERELGGATVIIVAQRVGTIMNADRIIVMDAGRIVGSGTHRELLATNETYREIVYSQLSEAEAAA